MEDEILNEVIIPIEGFYNYYSIPWDDSLYIKFPVHKLIVQYNGNKISFGSSFENDDDSTDPMIKRSHFMSENYLGSARETDTIRLKFILEDRKELVY